MMDIFKVTRLGISMFEAFVIWYAVFTVAIYGPDTVRLITALYRVVAGIYNWGGLL